MLVVVLKLWNCSALKKVPKELVESKCYQSRYIEIFCGTNDPCAMVGRGVFGKDGLLLKGMYSMTSMIFIFNFFHYLIDFAGGKYFLVKLFE